jgi:polysaccharide export outer membrane protein
MKKGVIMQRAFSSWGRSALLGAGLFLGSFVVTMLLLPGDSAFRADPRMESPGLGETSVAHAASSNIAPHHESIALVQYGAPCETCTDDNFRVMQGVHSGTPGCSQEPSWQQQRPLPFQHYGQGEYVGPARAAHTPEYRIRVDDTIQFIYRLTLEELSRPYTLQVGDTLRVDSITNAELNREVIVQPDGSISLLMLGPVRASRRGVKELQQDLDEKYRAAGVRNPALTVSPLKINSKLENLRAAVDNRFFSGGQGLQQRVMPDGFVRLPWVDNVPAQGLTLDELKLEVNERYRDQVDGLEVTPLLLTRAPRFVFVAGEVRQPGRYTLEGPTTAMMALALAGGTNNGGNLREMVVFRRTDDWRLMATRLDINGAQLGKKPCPADEIWLRDSDIVLVPKSPLLRADNFIELVFTRGLYAVVPAQTFFPAKTIFDQQNASTGS